MSQKLVWEKEYERGLLVNKGEEPTADFLRYLKFLRRKKNIDIAKLKILDLGSGTGRNSNYLASLGGEVVGIEIAKNAVLLARKRAAEDEINVEYVEGSIGSKYNFSDNYFDLVIDVTSSNSLNETERDVYLEEVSRVLKPGGQFFVRALCKDGDKNAKELLKKQPGKEKDVYIMKELNLSERVWTEIDFREFYGKSFKFLSLEKKTSYTRFNNQSYKRNFWLAYLEK